ncbi:MAG TPA: hypothetical protein VGG11_09200 [Xanthobacteraceae bacterium]|jgi:hypothetical protein
MPMIAARKLAQAISGNPTFRDLSGKLRGLKRSAAVSKLRDINSFERRVYSQGGEDGIIAELFARIPHHGYSAEISVGDGLECNSAYLIRHCGWKGLMVEGNPARFARLRASYAALPVKCVDTFVDRENVATILRDAGAPRDLDLLGIDIDGNDYYIWEALADYAASVVVIEYISCFGPDVSKTIAYNPRHVWRNDNYLGASLAALNKLGKRLGYALLGTNKRGLNAFFIRRDLLERSGFPEKTPQQAFHGQGIFDALSVRREGEFYFP